ncbi:hypothetical protein L7F22_031407 [Adiantum nelumboides]|nr:hypothetical protein [Adiantum nelumboides]
MRSVRHQRQDISSLRPASSLFQHSLFFKPGSRLCHHRRRSFINCFNRSAQASSFTAMEAQRKTHTLNQQEMRPFQIVVACTPELGIGLKGSIPWKLPSDIAFFKALTSNVSVSSKQNAVIMGRLTWESIPSKFRPLPGRLNVVLTRSPNPPSGDGNVLVCSSLTDALGLLAAPPYLASVDTAFVIGGGQVYK